jgi:putative ABC transport system permease protein
LRPAVAIGLLAALGLSRLVRALLFGVAPSDPLTYAASGALLSVLAIVAALGPARRAMRIGPGSALRAE